MWILSSTIEEMENRNAGCKSAGNRRNDAVTISMADGFDAPIQRKKHIV